MPLDLEFANGSENRFTYERIVFEFQPSQERGQALLVAACSQHAGDFSANGPILMRDQCEQDREILFGAMLVDAGDRGPNDLGFRAHDRLGSKGGRVLATNLRQASTLASATIADFFNPGSIKAYASAGEALRR